MRTLDEVIAELPATTRRRIEVRTQELIAEQLTLQDLRKVRKRTQKQMAKELNIGQDSVSRIEKRSDILLSTMRSYIQAMGGSLDLVASFPDRGPVIITSLEDVAAAPRKTARKASKKLLVKKNVTHAGLISKRVPKRPMVAVGKRAPKHPVVARASRKSSTR
jgi:transcriptional regulator with XRE-family HTH domain